MTTTNSQKHDSFSDGLNKFAEATRHSMTASRLAAAGTMALGAAAYFYLSNPERRDAMMDSATRMFEGMTRWWEGPSGMKSEAPSATAATSPAPGTAA